MLWTFLHTPDAPDDDIHRFPILFVYGKKERRQHDSHHSNTSDCSTHDFLQAEICTKSDADANSKAEDLPQGQTEKEFAFYGVDIDGDRDIKFI